MAHYGRPMWMVKKGAFTSAVASVEIKRGE